MKSVVAIALVAVAAAATTSVGAMKSQRSEQVVISSAGVVTDTTLPTGAYSESCQSCSMLPGTNPQTTSTLACQCWNAQGSLSDTSYLQNAWACNGCVNNNNGNLVCQLPPSSTTDGYQSQCNGCGLNNGFLTCKTCNNITPVTPYLLPNACSYLSVSFVDGVLIGNSAGTSTPTVSPTNAPTAEPTGQPSTKSPTPNAAPTSCESYWLTLSATGEKAPYKPCGDGSFTNSNGCQYNNYCCWQPTSSTSPQTVGVCKVPSGVPVDCPTLGETACLQNRNYCSWNGSYGSSGLCQRICPGNPETLCALT